MASEEDKQPRCGSRRTRRPFGRGRRRGSRGAELHGGSVGAQGAVPCRWRKSVRKSLRVGRRVRVAGRDGADAWCKEWAECDGLPIGRGPRRRPAAFTLPRPCAARWASRGPGWGRSRPRSVQLEQHALDAVREARELGPHREERGERTRGVGRRHAGAAHLDVKSAASRGRHAWARVPHAAAVFGRTRSRGARRTRSPGATTSGFTRPSAVGPRDEKNETP